MQFTGDTAREWRRDVLQPFVDQYLKDGAPAADTPPVWMYETGTDRWRRLATWPATTALTPLYLQAGMSLGFGTAASGHDDYVSDPAHPIPFVPRPVRMGDGAVWKPWLISDQRPANARPDVLSYTGPVLTAAVHIAGQPMVDLFAATTGTDADWVVKLIDVYPDEVPSQPELGGYELPVALDIFRGRYRQSLSAPTAIPANTPQRYRFALPNADHVFLPGHRIMVQISSSLFPLYDRNPQTFVPNIFNARRAIMSRRRKACCAAARRRAPSTCRSCRKSRRERLLAWCAACARRWHRGSSALRGTVYRARPAAGPRRRLDRCRGSLLDRHRVCGRLNAPFRFAEGLGSMA